MCWVLNFAANRATLTLALLGKNGMTKQQAKERIEKLKKEIDHHRYLYHVLDKSEISPSALDSLKHELHRLEQQFPGLITPDSPSQRVAGQPLPFFKKVSHAVPMLSLEDAFNAAEFSEWSARVAKLTPHRKLDFFGELKIDGFAVALIYKKGVLAVGSTRGDGKIGEDVTENLKTIEAIPLRLRQPNESELKKNGLTGNLILKAVTAGSLEIRGEVFMSKAAFEKINREQEKAGLPHYANPRNTAAGSIRQLDPALAAKRRLDFLAYDIVGNVGQTTHAQEHQLLKLLGFKTDKLARELASAEAAVRFWDDIKKKREKLAWEIDGIVVSVNNNQLFGRLGVVGKTPRGAVAFKFPGKDATTRVKDIIVQVGRTGVLTPVAVLEPVKISGVTVTRATLHNEDEIRRLDIRVGDTVIVQRAGDVIPDVVKVLTNLRPRKTKEFHFPKKCPVCGRAVVRPKGEAAHRCGNKNCPAQKREALYHFVSKKAFDIVGLGTEIMDKLAEVGLVKDAADIFELKPKDLLELEGFAEVSANKLVASIQKSKKITLARFIYSLGIVHVGEEMANLLAVYFGSLEDLVKANAAELEKVPGIGEKASREIENWFADKSSKELVRRLLKVVDIQRPPKISKKLVGKTFVFTGILEKMTRDEAKEKVRLLGGDVSSSVSKETDYLVAGENPGSKYDKAKQLGVKIISERDFLNMLG